MAGRRHPIAAPGEPTCPAEGCDRPAGFGTDHDGDGHCFRHRNRNAPVARSQPAPSPPGPTPGAVAIRDEAVDLAPPPWSVARREPAPLTRRVTGPTNPNADPLRILRVVLDAGRRAGMSFEEAWTLGAETALSYMTVREAERWWDALSATEQAWADAYARHDSRLASFSR